MYGPEREIELATLCDPSVRAAVEAAEVRLCSFAELPRSSPSAASAGGEGGAGPDR